MLLDEASEADQMRVASMASRLEQWFVCQRRLAAFELELGPEQTNLEGKIDQSNAIASGPPRAGSVQAHRCPASYDGHLCWPAGLAGERPVRMACPRVRALPSKQEGPHSQQADLMGPKSASSVISSPTMPVMQLAAQQANSSGDKVIAFVAAQSGERSGAVKLTNGNAQDTVNDANGEGKFSKV